MTSTLLRLLVSAFVCLPVVSLAQSVSPPSMDALDESNAGFTMIPAFIRQTGGKYPKSHIILFRKGCGQDSSKRLPDKVIYSVELSGSGLTAKNVKRDDECSVSLDLEDASTDPGTGVIKVRAGDSQVGTSFLHFVDPLTGPIPPGPPQVDVLWAPISYKVCDKAFSRSVAKHFYCIALKIGNNSGYQLQVAGVGFDVPFGSPTNPFIVKTPNSSYALTRAVAQNDDSPRSDVVHSIEGLGLLMSSAAPFFHSERAKARYGIGMSIVGGPLEAAFNLIVPDHSLRQANNLDDQSLRDGKLIPNNTQVTTVVFLDKGSVSIDYKRACDHLFGSYDVGRVAAPALSKNLQDITRYKSEVTRRKGSTSTSVAVHSPSESDETPFALLPQKEVATKLQRLYTKAVAAQYDQCASGNSSSGLKEALGSLVLVGDEIQYMQRIVVDQTTRSQETAVGAQPDTLPKLSYKALSISGRNLDKLPSALNVVTSAGFATASRDATSTPEAATYTLLRALRDGALFTVQSSGNALPYELHGTVANPVANIDTVSISGDTLTLVGTYLDLLPDSLTLCGDGTDKCKAKKDAATEKSATYKLAPDRAAPKVVTVKTGADYTVTGDAKTGTDPAK